MSESDQAGNQARCPRCGSVMPARAPEGLCPRCLGALNLGPDTVLTGDEPAAPLPLTSPAELAPHFPQLEILECLGRGGMGVVYKARQKSLDRLVALKLLAPGREQDPAFAERFAREAQALARLSHPNIVTIHDFGQAGGFYYLLMEFVDGVNLRQLLRSRKLTPEEALAIVPPLCDALQYAHERGIVHRDIKPENLLLDKGGRIKIADFGIAKMLGTAGGEASSSDPAAHSTTAGTPEYMAPEQKSSPQQVDSRADIYSLGVVFYEMLTGELPGAKLQPPSRKVQLDVRLDEIVLRALEVKPELRFATAAEFRAEIATLTKTPIIPQPTPRPDGKVWEREWLGLPALPRLLIRRGLFFVALLFTLNFAAPHLSHLGNNTQTWTTGLFPTPWLADIKHILANGSNQSEVHAFFTRFSFLSGFIAVVAWVALSAVLKAENGPGLLRLRGEPDAHGHQSVLWGWAFLTWISLYALMSLATCFGIALFMAISGSAPPVMPALAFNTFPVTWFVGLAVIKGALPGKPDPSLARRYLRWTVAFGVLCIALVAGLVTLYLLRSANNLRPPPIPVELSPVRSTVPKGDRIIRNDASVLVVHDDVDVHYVLLTKGAFDSTSRSSYNQKSLLWMDDGDLKLPNGRSFGYQRESVYPDFLRVNGQEFDLRKGRVIELLPDGVMRQISIFPNLATARMPEVLAVNIASFFPDEIIRQPQIQLNPASVYQGIVLGSVGSLSGYPLHYVVIRFAGPDLSEEDWSLKRGQINGPILAPSLEERPDGGRRKEPNDFIDARGMWVKEAPAKPSSVRFLCPGACTLRFAMPGTNFAEEARLQMAQVLAQPASVALGQRVRLFSVGPYEAWLETERFQPVAGKLSVSELPGSSYFTNVSPNMRGISSMLATIPPGHELNLAGSFQTHGSGPSEKIFQTTLRSQRDKPGLYAIAWNRIPDPGDGLTAVESTWQFRVIDTDTGREIYAFTAPADQTKYWRRDWGYSETQIIPPGETLHTILFTAKDTRPEQFVMLKMVMRESPESSTGAPAFGSIQDQSLAYGSTLDFSSGAVGQMPGSLRAVAGVRVPEDQIYNWMKGTNADVAYPGDGNFYGMMLNMITFKRAEWDTCTAEQLAAALHGESSDLRVKFDHNEPEKYTFGFKTGDARIGLLQITGFTKNPRGVQLRYKLVEAGPNPTDAAKSNLLSKSVPSGTFTNTTPFEGAPELRFLRWWEPRTEYSNLVAWHWDGSAIMNQAERKLLEQLQLPGFDYGNPKLATVQLAFSHPAFDQLSRARVTVSDTANGNMLLSREGIGTSSRSPSQDLDGNGWTYWVMTPGEKGRIPGRVAVELAVDAGPWSNKRNIAPDFRGTMTLEANSFLGSIGQDSQGQTFLSITRQVKEPEVLRIGCAVAMKNGRLLDTLGVDTTGTGAIITEVFRFKTPIDAVKQFQIRTRPIHTFTYRDVSLQVGHSTQPAVATGTLQNHEAHIQDLEFLPPVVVSTSPVSGTREVAPGITEVRVRFSNEMADGSWSWSDAWEDSTPQILDGPTYEDSHTCRMKVKLEPGKTYAWWLNSETFHNFKDRGGQPAVPYLLIFQTRDR